MNASPAGSPDLGRGVRTLGKTAENGSLTVSDCRGSVVPSRDAANFRGPVLGCIEAKFGK